MARRPEIAQESVVIPFDHPQVTDDTEWKIFQVPPGKTFRLDRVDYLNPTGLAEDTTNVFALSVKNGATVMAGPLSTDSDGAGADNSIAADTFTEIPLSATDSDLIAAAGDEISLLADEGGAATLPAGRLTLHGRYV